MLRIFSLLNKKEPSQYTPASGKVRLYVIDLSTHAYSIANPHRSGRHSRSAKICHRKISVENKYDFRGIYLVSPDEPELVRKSQKPVISDRSYHKVASGSTQRN